jgi:hypothetical protein
MTIIPKNDHVGAGPSWDCGACGRPWPCANGKESLLEEFRDHPSVLTIYLSTHLSQATLDLTAHGEDVPADLYERFLGWVRPPRTGLGDQQGPPST